MRDWDDVQAIVNVEFRLRFDALLKLLCPLHEIAIVCCIPEW